MVCHILAGCGLPIILETLNSLEPEKYAQSKILQDHKIDDIKPEMVTQYALEEKDELCINTIRYLIEYTAKNLTELALLYIPTGGIYLTSTVYQVCRPIFEMPEVKAKFLEIFQNRASLSELLKTIPITLVLCKDLAIKGCVVYSLQELL